jgi:hypothetical protein
MPNPLRGRNSLHINNLTPGVPLVSPRAQGSRVTWGIYFLDVEAAQLTRPTGRVRGGSFSTRHGLISAAQALAQAVALIHRCSGRSKAPNAAGTLGAVQGLLIDQASKIPGAGAGAMSG